MKTGTIQGIHIDMANNEIRCTDTGGQPILFPLSSSGGTIVKFNRNTVAGLAIQILVRAINMTRSMGGNLT